MARAVLFDVGDTLAYLDQAEIDDVLVTIATQAGADPGEFRDAWRSSRLEARVAATGSAQRHMEVVLRSVAVRLPPDRLTHVTELEQQAWFRAVKPYPEAQPTLHQLRGRGFLLGVVSNMSILAASAIRRLELSTLLDRMVFSCDVQSAKPDPAIYLQACALLDLAPYEAIFVADGEGGELAAAKRLGMATVAIRQPNQRPTDREDPEGHHLIGNLSELLDVVAGSKS